MTPHAENNVHAAILMLLLKPLACCHIKTALALTSQVVITSLRSTRLFLCCDTLGLRRPRLLSSFFRTRSCEGPFLTTVTPERLWKANMSSSIRGHHRHSLVFSSNYRASYILLTVIIFLLCNYLPVAEASPTIDNPAIHRSSIDALETTSNRRLSFAELANYQPIRRALLTLSSLSNGRVAQPSESSPNGSAAQGQTQTLGQLPLLSHLPSRLFEHFDIDNDGLLSEKEVAALLKLLTKKKKDEPASLHSERPVGTHDISIDGETISVGQGEFDILFKQLSNLKQTKDPSKDPRMTLQEDIIFVKDLVIVFLAATIGGVIATNFRQPPLIGFLLGGMVVGPGGFGVVTELVEVETLASLGISFLLFSLGIEFSLSELHGVRRVVLIGGLSSTCGVVVVTAALSLLMSLVASIPEAVALGLAVSLSSTAVVLQCLPSPHSSPSHSGAHTPTSGTNSAPTGKSSPPPTEPNPLTAQDSVSDLTSFDIAKALDKSSAKEPVFAFDSPRSRKVMLGLLVFQDVMIGLILALLPTLRGSLPQFVEELLSALLRLGCFVMLCLILAEFVLPSLSERLDSAKSQEVFTIGVVVFCLAMSYLSEEMGLAIELGAFAAGIMLSESRLKTRVEDSIASIRNMFCAVFFISVGMMIHWRYFYQNFIKMAVLLVIILVSKTVVMGAVICVLGGLPIRTAMACGSAIAQAGEFTFVVASKGQALQLFSAPEARMINGATALSMLATPYIIRYARKFTTTKGISALQRGDSNSQMEYNL